MKKLLIFLMVAIPLVIIIILNVTVSTVAGYVSVPVDSVEITEDTITGNIGEVYKLSAKIFPENATNKKLIWKSDNEEVALVDVEGRVSYIGFGKCHITATSEDGNKQDSCYFYITDTIAHNVQLGCEKTEIEVGSTVQLVSTIYPAEAINKEVEYKSFDTNIATIDSNGFVQALSPGYVTFSSTAVETGAVGFISLYVYEPIKAITLAKERDVVSQGTYQIDYQVFPFNATKSQLAFVSSNEEVATVSKNGLVTFKKAGKVDVYVQSVDNKVKEKISLTSTFGCVEQIYVDTTVVNATLSDAPVFLDITTEPLDVDLSELTIKSDDPKVCYVDENNYIQYVSTGSTIVRIRGEKADGSIIEKTVFVSVVYPAENITIPSVMYSAQKTYQLRPVSYPDFSTNQEFFFESRDNSIAQVSQNGVVTFLTEDSASVDIRIYANSNKSDVYKDVTVVYTKNAPQKVEIEQNEIKLVVGDVFVPNFVVNPSNSALNFTDVSLCSQQPNVEGDDVVMVDQSLTITALHGGKSQIKATYELFDGTVEQVDIYVDVESLSQSIEFVCDLDVEDGVYITGVPTINFSSYILPSDCSDKNIRWTVASGKAVIIDNSLKFNTKGQVTLLGESADGKTQKQVTIAYVGPNPLSATLTELPKNIYVGDQFEISVISTYPSNAMLTNVSYTISNQQTLSTTSNKVIEVVNGKLVAVSGGTCTLIVNVSSGYQQEFDVEVKRNATNIEVSPSNIQTTKNEVTLVATVLPYDTTDKRVEYFINDTTIAEINGDVLQFKKNGIVEITASCVANPSVVTTFYIEKIDKAATTITPSDSSIVLALEEKSVLNISSFCDNFEEYSIELQDEDVVKIEGNLITALNTGTTTINLYFFDENGIIIKLFKIQVRVEKLVEDIILFEELDFVNGEYQTALDAVNLVGRVVPHDAANQQIEFEIQESYTSSGSVSTNIAYINSRKLKFLQSGIVILKARACDNGGVVKSVRIRYTGGNATGAVLNVSNTVLLNMGDKLTIQVEQWIPKDTVNKQIFIEEIYKNVIGANVIEINQNEITAVGGGISRIRVELSNGISKIITISVSKLVSSIYVEDCEIVTAKKQYQINATALPKDASNKVLNYSMLSSDIATIEEGVVKFSKAGTVYVTVSTTDGSNIQQTVQITSTFGQLTKLTLSEQEMLIVKNSQRYLSIKSYEPADFDLSSGNFSYSVLSGNTNIVAVEQSGIVRAILGGSEIVKVVYTNLDGSEVSDECVVTVATAIDELNLTFIRSVDVVYGTYTTAESEIDFDLSAIPVDAIYAVEGVEVSDDSVAVVENNKITFKKEGKVDITFVAKDLLDNSVTKTCSFYYTAGKIIDAQLYVGDFTMGKLVLVAGESYRLKFSKIVPKDAYIDEFEIIDKVESRNDMSLPVGVFNNDVFVAQNGGTVSFKIQANSFVSQTIKIEVVRNPKAISTSLDVYCSTPAVQLNWQVLPGDTTNKSVTFKCDDTSIATVDSTGYVRFSDFGMVHITIKCAQDENISKTVCVTYSNKVQQIEFKNIPNEMFIRGRVVLGVTWAPFGVEDFNVKYEVSNPDLATITKDNKLIAGSTAGEIILRAYVEGNRDVYCEMTIKIKSFVTDIELELDKIDDNCGIGGYRVFGHSWFTNVSMVETKYKMEIKSIVTNGGDAELIWSSSDESIGKVDETGLVTFTGKSGQVTITVQPKDQMTTNEDYFLKDSYTFTIVRGVNVYNAEQLKMVTYSKTSAAVLQSDITYGLVESVRLRKNLYGNGHILDVSTDDYVKGFNRVEIRDSDVLVDNVQIRGAKLGENSALSELNGHGVSLIVETSYEATEKVQNVVIKNSILENGSMTARAYGADCKFVGCVFRNSFFGDLVLTNNNKGLISEVTVEDCIFTTSMLGGIIFDIRDPDKANMDACKLKLVGDVKLMTWVDIDEMDLGAISDILSDASDYIKQSLKSNTKYTKTYGGKTYFHSGITAFQGGVEGIAQYTSKLDVDVSKLSSKYQYIYYDDVQGMMKVVGVPAHYELRGYTLPSTADVILPGDKLEDDPNALINIRKPLYI